jgi:hypothetical protein
MNAIQEITALTVLSILALTLIASGIELDIKPAQQQHISGYVKDMAIDHSTEPYSQRG